MLKFENSVTTHHKVGKVEYLTFKILDQYKDKIKYGFFLRKGGVSEGIYDSLNFRFLGKDSKENVNKNIEIALNTLGLKEGYKASQKHTSNILELTNNNKANYGKNNLNADEYDAYIHVDVNIPSIITVADCNPIIIYDPIQNIIANIHSGWSGTIRRISIKTAEELVNNYGSKFEDLIVCIGPSIRNCHFISKEKEFKDKFLESYYYINEKEYITYEDDNQTFHIDLIHLIKYDLLKLGVIEKNIKIADICTVCNNDDFFSYRVNTKKGDIDYATSGVIVTKL